MWQGACEIICTAFFCLMAWARLVGDGLQYLLTLPSFFLSAAVGPACLGHRWWWVVMVMVVGGDGGCDGGCDGGGGGGGW